MFLARREPARPVERAPLDNFDRLVLVEGSARGPSDRIRPSEIPSRPAKVNIVTTGLRKSFDALPFGLHVRISRRSGVPRGRQAVFANKVNIARPQPASYGTAFELEGSPSQEESLSLFLPA